MTINEGFEDAREAAEGARLAAEETAELVRERSSLTDEQVAQGVETAMGQQALKAAAAQLEKEGWTVQSVSPGEVTLQGGPPMNWWVHGLLPLCTAFLSLIWTAKVAKRPRGTVRLTLDQLGRVQMSKS